MQSMCDDCYKTLVEILKDLNKWRTTSTLWIERLNIVKMFILPQFIFGLTAITIPNFAENWYGDSKIMKKKRH